MSSLRTSTSGEQKVREYVCTVESVSTMKYKPYKKYNFEVMTKRRFTPNTSVINNKIIEFTKEKLKCDDVTLNTC